MKALSFFSLVFLAMLVSCASVKTEQSSASKKSELQTYPTYSGAKKKVQVIRFGISEEVAQKYPELGKKNVGWGLYNRLADELYQTGRYEFTEEKASMQSRIMQEWALSQSGATIEEKPMEGLQAPDYLIYAEIFEFAVSTEEQVVGISVEKKNSTHVGIQIRLVDASNGEYIPASGEGQAVTTGKSIWLMPDMSFDQSTVGLASKRAIHNAVFTLLQRISQKQNHSKEEGNQ